MKLTDQIANLSNTEKFNLITTELEKLNFTGRYALSKDIDVEVLEIKKINYGEQYGIQVLARAWFGTQQIGFGPDGSVDVERFKIWTPEIYVYSTTGEYSEDYTKAGNVLSRKYTENPLQALKNQLLHTISVVGKPGANITPGKIGNTTDTFSMAADNTCQKDSGGTNFTTEHDAANADTMRPAGAKNNYAWCLKVGSAYYIDRAFSSIDTSSIPDGDAINSATFSIYGMDASGTNVGGINVYNVASTLTNPIALADYNNGGTTAWSTEILHSAFNGAGWNDFSLNATGLAAINKTGNTELCVREKEHDVANTSTGISTGSTYFGWNRMDAASNTPKLVVDHGSSSPINSNFFRFFGPQPQQ